jgi:hypothetical protein
MRSRVAARGVFVVRAPIDYHDFDMNQTKPAFQTVCSSIRPASSHQAATGSGEATLGDLDATTPRSGPRNQRLRSSGTGFRQTLQVQARNGDAGIFRVSND